MLKKYLRPTLVLFAILSLVCGVVYPLFVSLVGKTVFPHQAAGSLIWHNGQLIGSEMIGQSFSSPRYFWGRPSATNATPNNPMASGGSNMGVINPARLDAVKERIRLLKEADSANMAPIPVDLVTASGSGLDPDISIAAAYYQVNRISKARGIDEQEVKQLVDENRQNPYLGIWGEPRVNVLRLNLALDQRSDQNRP